MQKRSVEYYCNYIWYKQEVVLQPSDKIYLHCFLCSFPEVIKWDNGSISRFSWKSCFSKSLKALALAVYPAENPSPLCCHPMATCCSRHDTVWRCSVKCCLQRVAEVTSLFGIKHSSPLFQHFLTVFLREGHQVGLLCYSCWEYFPALQVFAPLLMRSRYWWLALAFFSTWY